MTFATVCSGIEAPTVAWPHWESLFFSEINPFCRALLSSRYPNTPNLGDMLNHESWPTYTDIDVFGGGTPCQPFSLAGLRKGLSDPRGNLTLCFLSIIARHRPRWIWWENVPGILSDKSNAFGHLLCGLAELGYGFAYRTFDAQYFGLAQLRQRVFVVGHSSGSHIRSAAVLFERESLLWHSPPSRKEGQGIARSLTASTGGCSAKEQQYTFVSEDNTPLNPLNYRMTAFGEYADDDKASAMKARDHKDATDLVLCFHSKSGVRRLTPLECERLQGFPDDYTLVPYRGKPATDAPRYRALGNSIAVPVLSWIGRRIQLVDDL